MKEIDFIIQIDKNYQIIQNGIKPIHIDLINNLNKNVYFGGSNFTVSNQLLKYYCDNELYQNYFNNTNLEKNVINQKIYTILRLINKKKHTGGNRNNSDKIINNIDKINVNLDSHKRYDSSFPPRRIIFLIIYKNNSYIMKTSLADVYINGYTRLTEIDKIANLPPEKRKYQISKLPLDTFILGNYLYEARIYEEVNNCLELSEKFKNNSIKLIDYGVFNRMIDKDKLVITINNELINININNMKFTTNNNDCKSGKKKYFCKNILEVLNEGYNGLDDTPISYLITECNNNYSDFRTNFIKVNRLECCFNVVDTLMYLKHKIGFSHNDLHGGNILKNDKCQIKLYDFDCSDINNGNSRFWDIRRFEYSYSKIIKIINFIIHTKKYYKSNRCLCTHKLPSNSRLISYCYDLFRLLIETFMYHEPSLAYPNIILHHDDKSKSKLIDKIKALNYNFGESFHLSLSTSWLIFGNVEMLEFVFDKNNTKFIILNWKNSKKVKEIKSISKKNNNCKNLTKRKCNKNSNCTLIKSKYCRKKLISKQK